MATKRSGGSGFGPPQDYYDHLQPQTGIEREFDAAGGFDGPGF
jgi:hypothetical protein